MTLHAFCDQSMSPLQKSAVMAHHLASLRTLLDVHDELLLRLLQLRALAVKLALRFREGALVLPQPLRRSDCAPE